MMKSDSFNCLISIVECLVGFVFKRLREILSETRRSWEFFIWFSLWRNGEPQSNIVICKFSFNLSANSDESTKWNDDGDRTGTDRFFVGKFKVCGRNRLADGDVSTGKEVNLKGDSESLLIRVKGSDDVDGWLRHVRKSGIDGLFVTNNAFGRVETK
jgi:hypothetical protein